MAEQPAGVGVFGGTFDPIHNGHVALARAAAAELGLRTLTVIPCGTPPHRAAAQTAGDHRLEMARLALAGDARFQVDDMEVRRSGPSYTLDTVRAICSRRRVGRVWLIIGADAVAELPDWHQPESLLRFADLAVAGRAGWTAPDAAGEPPWQALAARCGARVCELNTRLPEISSTVIRQRLANGDDTADLLDERVRRYIFSHGLYGTSGEQAAQL